MQKDKRTAIPPSLIAVALFLGLAALALTPGLLTQRAQSQGSPREAQGIAAEDLIEVHGPQTAYVPTTAKYVKYDGAVRRVVKFAAALEPGEDCPCPRCCDGRCYVIVFTDPVTPGGPLRVPYILWLEC
jgi:hypothetical protein